MASEIVMGKWMQLKGLIQERWGELTNDELDKIEGNTDQLVGLLRERYGYTMAQAKAKVAEFLAEHR